MYRYSWVFQIATLALACYLFTLVSQKVPSPYLDEVFHIPQTQRYCRASDSDYRGALSVFNITGLLRRVKWNDKITTPPGLYLLGNIYAKYVSHYVFPGSAACGTIALRTLNFLGTQVVLQMTVNETANPVGVTAFPLLFFFGLLFYTDVWATIFVLAAVKVGGQGSSRMAVIISAVLAWISLTFRQTNIVWSAFTAVVLLENRYLSQNQQAFRDKKEPHPATSPVSSIVGFVKVALTTPSITFPFAAVGASFAYFLHWNGGIALGDKSHHAVSINPLQLLHFLLHVAFFLGPPVVLAALLNARDLTRTASVKRIATFITAFTLFAVALGLYVHFDSSLAHPFLLADNRHYTFYIWRKLYLPARVSLPFSLLVAGPLFAIGLAVFALPFLYSDNWKMRPCSSLFLMAAILFTLVPSPLLEPRYYIVPIVLWRTRYLQALVARHQLKWLPVLETLWYLVINIITVYLFLYYPFIWPNEPMKLQRFMW